MDFLPVIRINWHISIRPFDNEDRAQIYNPVSHNKLGKKNIERVKGGANRSSDLGHVPVPTNNKRSDIIRHNIIQQLVYPFFIYLSIYFTGSFPPSETSQRYSIEVPFLFSLHIYHWWCWLAFRTLSCTSLSLSLSSFLPLSWCVYTVLSRTHPSL
jgi:hypothetical protein